MPAGGEAEAAGTEQVIRVFAIALMQIERLDRDETADSGDASLQRTGEAHDTGKAG
jgi:hypothetical protein